MNGPVSQQKEVLSVICAPSAKVYQPSTAVETTPEPKQSFKECDLRMMIPSICLSFETATIVRLMCALINELSELDSTCNLNMQFDLDFDFVFKIFN